MDRGAAADLSRGQVQLALGRDAHAGRACDERGPAGESRAHHGGRHRRPRLSGAGRGRVLRERGVPWCGSACPAAWSRASCRRTDFRSSGCGSAACAARASATWLLAPLRIAARGAAGVRILRRVRPRVGARAGGYVSGPGGIAAWLLRVPLLIHEQNAIAGMTNRWLARLAKPGARGVSRAASRRGSEARAIGNPVRADIAALPPPAARFAGRGAPCASAGVRRQPGRAAPERRRAAGAGAPRSLESARECATRPASADRGRPRGATPSSGRGGGAALHRRHGGGLCLGGSGAVPRRRHDRRRAAGRRPRAPFWCRSRARSTIIRPRTPRSWCARRGAGCIHERELTLSACARACSLAPTAASCSPWPSARDCCQDARRRARRLCLQRARSAA